MSAFIAYCLSTLLFWATSGYVIEDQAATSTEDHSEAAIDAAAVPFIAHVEINSCVAVIVHEQFLVAEAKCVMLPYCYDSFHKVILANNETVDVEQVFVHPKYVGNAMKEESDYNIAVIKLNQSLEWGEQVQPIRMADEYLVLQDGDRLRVISSDYLGVIFYKSDMRYVDQLRCQRIEIEDYSDVLLDISDRMLCADLDTNAFGQIELGPILIYNNTLVGLPITGYKEANTTMVFSRVSKLRSYVDSTIKINS